MKLTFLGAAREVTGSCTLIEAGGHRFLVDCGMEQGKDVYPNADLPCAPGEIEAILLTHAHIDHSGRIPYLYKNGFRGPIYSTDATMDLCEIMLEDSAHIQEQEAEWKNRKAQRSGNELVEPDYTVEDAMAVMKQFVPQSYGKPLEVFPGITATFTDVGHLLGSASITLQVTENGESQTIVFSGDIGNLDQPLIRNPQYLTKADFVVMESTYGDRTHGPKPDYVAELTQILQETFDRGGIVGALGLMGMLIKNCIVLLDEIGQRCSGDTDLIAGLVVSAQSRLRPVMMASLTTILGMIPLLGDAMFGSMAATIMGGLFFSTTATLLFLPILYALFFKIKTK